MGNRGDWLKERDMRPRTVFNEEWKCPICGEVLDYDTVDIGVGLQIGNYRCSVCYWTPDQDDVVYGGTDAIDDVILI